MIKRLSKDEAWDLCRGASWPWNYCATGTAAANAPGLQTWIQEQSDGQATASLRVCRVVAGEIGRASKPGADGLERIGGGLGGAMLA